MTFFKNIFSKQKSYTKYGDTLKKPLTTKEQRLEAIDVLENLKGSEAVPELLKRFELVVESGLQDRKEKEICLKAIVKRADEAKEPVRQYIKNKRRLAWVLRIAEQIFSSDEYRYLLLESLNYDAIDFDDDARERNLDILHVLKEIEHTDITDKVSDFLKSRDDDTCLVALQCLETQSANDENAKNIILSLAQNRTADINSRFMGAILHIIKKHNW